MGHSQTIHVIGQGKGTVNGNETTRRIYYAMNRVEMEQQRAKARRDGDTIESWYAQTKTGQRILGDYMPPDYILPDKDAPHVKLITCPVCEGDGHNGKYHCPVCDGSGLCKAGNERHWQDWQIEQMKREHAEAS